MKQAQRLWKKLTWAMQNWVSLNFGFNQSELNIQTKFLYRWNLSVPARVLLLGAGADEQLAGYSRHRARYQQTGLTGLHDEVSLEMSRISERNMGRDNRYDRIVAKFF